MPTGVRVVDRIQDQFDFAGSLTDGHYLGYVSGTGKFTLSAVTVPTAANPTGTVGLTAVNGSAGTFLRSDGAPALDQGIAPTWTGRHVFSINGAVSAPPVSLTGTWYSGGSATTTKPQVLIEPTGTTSTGWSTSGTGLGVNAASGFAGNLLDLQVAGASRLKVAPSGNGVSISGASSIDKIEINAGASGYVAIQGYSHTVYFTSDGVYPAASGRPLGYPSYGFAWGPVSTSGVIKFIHTDSVLAVGISRQATGVLEVNNGTVGAIRWLQDAGRTRLTADATNATATMSNLTDLSVTLIAGRKYTGELVIFADTDVGADGLAIDFDGGTATMTDFRTATDGTPNGATVGTSRSTALATDLTFTTIATYNVVYRFPLSIEVNAAGTFIPRFAQVAHTTGTLTIRKGSHLHLLDSVN